MTYLETLCSDICYSCKQTKIKFLQTVSSRNCSWNVLRACMFRRKEKIINAMNVDLNKYLLNIYVIR